ncbi:glycosyltransferase family 4 protein [Stigmatella aurantiaca]|uniref:Glycosyl transferase, group 1 n=1 Tax=Stigmatella aurantiaca (strain DW4/3-1) TaxID=378806 RepID=Q097R9_STIAD|nr:glycosyltransferase family 4 protein [Stigmatella aurantiaca]ADO68417.1 Glycosyl transferase, group 1 [Stigmatella aurantiaca DW4/3-1]EAU67996.1 glycosyl transferase, group 1 [Stigmatella aurantiaca DW4/3-1]
MGLRIAMLSAVFPPSVGGIQTHTLRLSQRLVAHGAQVVVLTRHHQGLPRREFVEGVEVLRLGQGDARREVATATYLADSLRVLVSRRDELDVMHAHQMLSPTSVGLLARKALGIPLVINPHACGPQGDVQYLRNAHWLAGGWRLDAARRWADAFVSISEPIREELRGSGIGEDRIWRIANGVDLDTFRPAGAEERQALRDPLGLPRGPVVTYSGRLAPEKGVDVLLEAWALLVRARPEATLVLLGNGPEEAALRRRVAQLGLGASVRPMGAVSDVPAWLRASDVFALASRTEGLPVALLEGMACALPAVATRVGGTPEVLDDGVHGRLVPSENPSALAEGLIEALAPGTGARWGAAARARVEARFSLDAIAHRLLQLYGGLVHERAGARSSAGTV